MPHNLKSARRTVLEAQELNRLYNPTPSRLRLRAAFSRCSSFFCSPVWLRQSYDPASTNRYLRGLACDCRVGHPDCV
jgi:hypothetical protein